MEVNTIETVRHSLLHLLAEVWEQWSAECALIEHVYLHIAISASH